MKVSVEAKSTGGVEKLCVTDYVVPREDGEPEPKTCDVIDMACLTSEINWDYISQKYKWSLSQRDAAYFHLIGRDRIPSKSEGLIIGDILVRNRKLCSRLCLRVSGCQAFSSTVQTTNTSRCVMYRETIEPIHLQMNTVYFTLT
ncbi:hypothetical protein Btru_032377 [Bulinus truncatus]|nr:hypothetical protein Btru_032377 [Bulinus truncatus]